jgi:hypothetical protein
MAIPKRLTAARKVVSCFDPAWGQVVTDSSKRGVYGDYCNTHDISVLGNPLDYPKPFTVFEVVPLKVQYEPYVDGDNTNWWEIFRTHVRSITGFEVEFDGDKIKDKYREEIGPKYVRDIARIIIEMSNVDGVSAFFTIPDGWLEHIQNCQRHHASEAAKAVRSAAANLSS